MKRRKKKRLKLKKWVWKTLLVIFLCLFIFFIIKIVLWKNNSNKNKSLTKKINDSVTVESVAPSDQDNTENINPPEDEKSDYWEYTKMDMINVNFDDLIKINKDTVAWIKVNGTNINYPVVQTNDNEYYLNHAFDGTYNKAGWLYLDYRNNIDSIDKNNVIYGHGRVDKTMFGSLKNIMNNDWAKNKDNHVVKLSTLKQNSLWKVFSVYKIKAESYYITTKFSNDQQFNEFTKVITKRSKFDFNTSVNSNDKILTLSTCLDSYGTRIVLHAKLIKLQNK